MMIMLMMGVENGLSPLAVGRLTMAVVEAVVRTFLKLYHIAELTTVKTMISMMISLMLMMFMVMIMMIMVVMKTSWIMNARGSRTVHRRQRRGE